MRKFAVMTSALLAGTMAFGAHAQQQGGQQGVAGVAQGGLPDQRLAQETAQRQGTELYISPAGVRLIQQALNQAGYNVGGVDGQWTQQTQQAVRNFQQAYGLEPTGQLYPTVISALGLQGLLNGQFAPGEGAGGAAQGGFPGQRLAQEASAGPGAQLYISPAGVRMIQQMLNQAGYDVGNVDGQWAQQTQQAVRNFQQANGLEPTGQLNVDTIAALGLNDLLSGRLPGGAAGTAQGGFPGQRLAQETSTGPGAPLHVSPSGVRLIQQALNQAGYDVGNVDGQWGQQTQQAWRNYQQANGLEPTGALNISSIAGLGFGGLAGGGGAPDYAGFQGGVTGGGFGQGFAQQGGMPGGQQIFGQQGMSQQGMSQQGFDQQGLGQQGFGQGQQFGQAPQSSSQQGFGQDQQFGQSSGQTVTRSGSGGEVTTYTTEGVAEE